MNSSRLLSLFLLSGAMIMEANASGVNKKSKTDDGQQTTVAMRESSSSVPSEDSKPAVGKRSREDMTTPVGNLVVPPSRGGNPVHDQQMDWLLQKAQRGDQEAYRQLKATADNGDKIASFRMAKYYTEPSKHVKRDLNLALEYVSKPCFTNSISGQLLKGKIHQELEQGDQALGSFKTCNELSLVSNRTNHREACYQIGRIYQNVLGDVFQAHNWFAKAAELKHPEATYKLALIYLDKQNCTLQDLETALKHMNAADELFRGGLANAQQNINKATAEIEYRMGLCHEQVAARFPTNSRPHALKMDEAVEKFTQAAARGHAKAKEGLANKQMDLAQLHMRLLDEPEHYAFHGERQNRWLLAAFDSQHPEAKGKLENVFNKKASRWPKPVQINFYLELEKRGHVGAKNRLPQTYYDEGRLLLATNNLAEAEAAFIAAAGRGFTEAWAALGDIYSQSGQQVRASECYEKCPNAKEKLADLRLQEAKSFLVEGSKQNAIKAILLLEQAYALSSGSNQTEIKELLIKTACEVAQRFAHSDSFSEEIDVSKKMYEKAAALGSRHAEIGLKHVEVLVSKKRLSQGNESVVPLLAQQLCELGGMLVSEGNLDQAVTYLTEAAELGSTDAACIVGAIYAKQRKPQEAEAWLRKSALKGHVVAQKNLVDFYLDGRGAPANVYEAMKWMLASGQVDRRLKLEALFKAGHKEAFPVKRNRLDSPLDQFLTYSDRISESGQDAICPVLQKSIHEIVHLASRVNALASDLIQEPILGTCYEMTPVLAKAHADHLRRKDDPEFLHEYLDSKGLRYLTIGVDEVRKAQDVQRLMAVENKNLVTPEVERQVVEGMACHMVWKALKEENQQQACEALYHKATQVVNLPDFNSIRSLSCFLQLVGTSCNKVSTILSNFNGSAIRYLLAKKGADVNDEIWQKVLIRSQKLCEAEKEKVFYINQEKNKFVGPLVSAVHKDLEERIAAVGARNKAMRELPIVQAISRAQPVHIDLLDDK